MREGEGRERESSATAGIRVKVHSFVSCLSICLVSGMKPWTEEECRNFEEGMRPLNINIFHTQLCSMFSCIPQ